MPDWIVAVLAVYGAALSTLRAISQILRERRRDAIAITVELSFGLIGSFRGLGDDMGVVIARAKNIGMRDVQMTSARFLLTGDMGYQPAKLPELPKLLKPTQSVDAWISNKDLAEIIKRRSAETGKGARLVGAHPA